MINQSPEFGSQILSKIAANDKSIGVSLMGKCTVKKDCNLGD